jgi:hypothetical protein
MRKPTGRPPGRPRVPDDQRLVSSGFTLKPALYDTIIKRARAEGVSVAQVVREDLALVEAWRRKKRAAADKDSVA